ncbi:MAG: L-seryl-tRNA(Sec) selenium transferase [Calditrichaeota bacterium]|nr:L-seryl-tRNA(Sec) selenium transferase [Calditrichota bacterium]MCB9473844.1 L-seryl-tRNA(Sec) selenium transferase [Candidatus Delongbacteria bacterium]
MTQTPERPLQELLAALPSIDSLLAEPVLSKPGLPARPLLVRLCRQEVERLRTGLKSGKRRHLPETGTLASQIADQARRLLTGGMLHVINATGVILHTGLGRAPLPEQAREALQRITRSFTNLEFRLETGARGVRHERVAELLCLLTGAEGALVCNNNAAAVLLMLQALCRRREVIVSRGQQVEIGGGFRIPDVIRESGARMVEVGTTNRTHASDYLQALGPRTAALLRVHPSNYRISGFTSQVELGELARLAREHGCLLLDDLGSGALHELGGFREPEPLVEQSLAAGADLVSFSGDKLLGASQAGLLVGRRELIARLEKAPLLRALRCDKLGLAVLEAVLSIHAEGGEALAALPVHRMLSESREQVRLRARNSLTVLGVAPDAIEFTLGHGRIQVVDSLARTGSGALPEEDVASVALRITSSKLSAARLQRDLRCGTPAVVGAVREEALWLDFKAILPGEETLLGESLAGVLN